MCSSIRGIFFLILIGHISASFMPDIGLMKTLVGGDKVDLLKFGLKLFLNSQSEEKKPEDKKLGSYISLCLTRQLRLTKRKMQK
jgi:hypothetical protein